MIQNVKGGNEVGSSTFVSLKTFILSIKGKTDNILKIPHRATNDLETSSPHRRTEYHVIFFNCFLISGAFHEPTFKSNKLCREYLVESILHGLDLTIINSSLDIFYKKFTTPSVVINEIGRCSMKIAEVILKFNQENKSVYLKELILGDKNPTSADAIRFCEEVSKLIIALPRIVNKSEDISRSV